MSRFWLVELHEDLAHLEFPTTRTGVWCGIHNVNGVKSLTDMSAISQTTLDLLLMRPTPALKAEEPSMYDAIRRYWRRKQQPELPLQ